MGQSKQFREFMFFTITFLLLGGAVLAAEHQQNILATALLVFPLLQVTSLILSNWNNPMIVYRPTTAVPTFLMVWFLAWVLFK